MVSVATDRQGVGAMTDDFNTTLGLSSERQARPQASPSISTRSDAAPVAARSDAGEKPSRARLEEWAGSPTPIQVKLPADLVKSLKLIGFDTGKTVSELVLECLTTTATIEKTWVASRRKAG